MTWTNDFCCLNPNKLWQKTENKSKISNNEFHTGHKPHSPGWKSCASPIHPSWPAPYTDFVTLSMLQQQHQHSDSRQNWHTQIFAVELIKSSCIFGNAGSGFYNFGSAAFISILSSNCPSWVQHCSGNAMLNQWRRRYSLTNRSVDKPALLL